MSGLFYQATKLSEGERALPTSLTQPTTSLAGEGAFAESKRESVQEKSAVGIERLLEAATCPVCLERLAPPLICCINGHAICCKCKGKQTLCPTCQQQFSPYKHTTLLNLIEILPSYCRHNGCSELSWNIKIHEKFCEFRQVRCKVCYWSGSVKELYNHLDNSADHKMSDGFKIPTVKSVQIDVRKIEQQYFWRTIKYDPGLKTFSIHLSCVPTQEVKSNHWLVVTMKSVEFEYIAKIKLLFNELSDDSTENKLFFSTENVKCFTSHDRSSEDVKTVFRMFQEYRTELNKVVKLIPI